jgi:diaminopimelate epimerase
LASTSPSGDPRTPLRICKAHAYGNDFVFAPLAGNERRGRSLAQALCDRHWGVGADGLILYESRPGAATMRLFNADGSQSELSGNGLRCLAVLLARSQRLPAGAVITVETDAGTKTLELLAREGERYTFRAALGQPEGIAQTTIDVAGDRLVASLLRIGNPQCVVLGVLPDADRFQRLGRALAEHSMFPSGTNVEFAHVEARDRVQIVIWERGVGPTTSSGTGAAAAAVAAAAHGGAARTVSVVAPGGTQQVEWREDGVFLTGWAEMVFEGNWLPERRGRSDD